MYHFLSGSRRRRKKMGILFQVISTGLLCLVGINIGLITTWPACTIIMFASENTTLNRPMTETEISLLGSLSSIGGMISTLTTGYFLDKFGRKMSCLVNGLTMVLFWAILIVSNQVEVVLACIFLSGISSSVFLVSSVYVSEICEQSIRGSMTATNGVSFGIGMLLLYGLGGALSYNALLYTGLSMTVGCMALLFILKESPTYLMQKGKEEEAAKAIAFFRHLKVDDKEVLEEIDAIKRVLNPDLDDLTPENEKLNPDYKPEKKMSFWRFMRKSKSTRRALLIGVVILTACIFQGFFIIQLYIEQLFSEAIPSISPAICSVVMAALTVVAGIVAAFLTDFLGRRSLMIYGSIGAGVMCVLLGTQLQFHWGPSWITAIYMYAFAIMFTFGAGTVPTVLLSEIYLPEVKSILNMILFEWILLCSALVVFIFNPLLNAIGWGPVFYIFAIICMATAVFCVFFLPETKGLTVEEIQQVLIKKKQRNKC